MTLVDALKWVLLSGGAGVLAYFLMGRVPELAGMQPEPKRYASWLLSAVFACLAFSLMVALGYSETPESVQGWIEQLFYYSSLAVGVSQVTHARKDLAKR